jgi:hypothetical protein
MGRCPLHHGCRGTAHLAISQSALAKTIMLGSCPVSLTNMSQPCKNARFPKEPTPQRHDANGQAPISRLITGPQVTTGAANSRLSEWWTTHAIWHLREMRSNLHRCTSRHITGCSSCPKMIDVPVRVAHMVHSFLWATVFGLMVGADRRYPPHVLPCNLQRWFEAHVDAEAVRVTCRQT